MKGLINCVLSHDFCQTIKKNYRRAQFIPVFNEVKSAISGAKKIWIMA